MIKIYGFENTKEAGVAAAKVIADAINNSEKPSLGLATGSSPIDLYKALIDMNKKGEVSPA